MLSELMLRPTHRRVTQSVFCLAITGLLCASMLSCKKATPPNQPTLHFEKATETKLGHGSGLWGFKFTGRAVKQVTFWLEVFENGTHEEVGQLVFSKPSGDTEFHGEVTILVNSGELFDAEDKQVIVVTATIEDAFSLRSSAGHMYVFDESETRTTGRGHSRGSFDPSRYIHLWHCEYSSPELHEHGCDTRTRETITEYSKEGRKIIAVSLEWQPQQ